MGIQYVRYGSAENRYPRYEARTIAVQLQIQLVDGEAAASLRANAARKQDEA